MTFALYQAVVRVVTKAQGAGVLVYGENDGFPPTVAGIVLLCQHQAANGQRTPKRLGGLALLRGDRWRCTIFGVINCLDARLASRACFIRQRLKLVKGVRPLLLGPSAGPVG